MRELTKSTLSAGLAMSLFSMQTMMNAFRRPPSDGPNPAVEALDAVTQAMVDHSGDTLRETFQAGDKIQRELIDMGFRFLTFAPMRPAAGTSTVSDMTRQATDRFRKWMGDMNPARGSCGGCGGAGATRAATSSMSSSASGGPSKTGWGPMPDQS